MYCHGFKNGHHPYNLHFICTMYHPTVMYRRHAVLSVGGYTQQYAEDYALFWELSQHYKIHEIEQVLLDYRMTNQSLHHALHKTEYEWSHCEQVLRHVRFYMGDSYQINPNHLACICHFFEPLLLENSVQSIVECIEQLDNINQCILTKESVRQEYGSIQEAISYKRQFILSYYILNLGRVKGMWLLIMTNSWNLLWLLLKNKLTIHK